MRVVAVADIAALDFQPEIVARYDLAFREALLHLWKEDISDILGITFRTSGLKILNLVLRKAPFIKHLGYDLVAVHFVITFR